MNKRRGNKRGREERGKKGGKGKKEKSAVIENSHSPLSMLKH